ncbi:class C sortase, partial [Bifidobacterium breve]|nr:class C sortase [Bifidobacterium breve]
WLLRRHKPARIMHHAAFWPWHRRDGESANDTLRVLAEPVKKPVGELPPSV